MASVTPLQASGPGISPYNPLVVSLALLAAGAAIATVFLYREAMDRHRTGERGSFAWLFGLIGVIGLLISGEIFWANWAGFQAAQYTELFGVAQTLYAAVMIAAAFVIYTDLDPRPFTWFTAIAGLVLLQGARAILTFQLTRSPPVSAGIWGTAGLAGVVLLPAAYLEEGSNARRYLVLAAVALLAILTALALVMAVESHYGHIAEVVSG